MSPNPHDWNDSPFGGPDGPSFEEIARLMQSLMNGDADVDPELLRQLGLPEDPAVLRQMMTQAQSMMSQAQGVMSSLSDSDATWTRAQDAARRIASGEDESTVLAGFGIPGLSGPGLSGPGLKRSGSNGVGFAGTGGETQPGEISSGDDAERARVQDAFHLAALWLNESTSFEAPPVSPRVYTPRQWVEASFPAFREMTEPLGTSVTEALTTQLAEQVPPQMKAMLGQASSMMSGVGASLFAIQLSRAVGALGRSVLGTSDIGVPIIRNGLGLVPQNVREFSTGLEIDQDQVRIYLALREEAHARLFHRAPWLSSHVMRAVTDYGRGVEIDMRQIEDVARSVDPTQPEAVQQALGEGLFQPTTSDSQRAALTRLETLLALIEGWVDVVVNTSAARLPDAAALAETIRRRRVTQGPSEKVFSGLVGLELRPRRLRDAAALFTFIEREGGVEARDTVWTHPDLLPSTEDLDDPAGYWARQRERAASDADVDAELAKLLEEGLE